MVAALAFISCGKSSPRWSRPFHSRSPLPADPVPPSSHGAANGATARYGGTHFSTLKGCRPFYGTVGSLVFTPIIFPFQLTRSKRH